jgi:hypothetical protein
VEHNKPGEANIENEFSSQKNRFFILHDSKGFEPGDNDTFNKVKNFISQRSKEKLETQESLHAIWSVRFIMSNAFSFELNGYQGLYADANGWCQSVGARRREGSSAGT